MRLEYEKWCAFARSTSVRLTLLKTKLIIANRCKQCIFILILFSQLKE